MESLAERANRLKLAMSNAATMQAHRLSNEFYSREPGSGAEPTIRDTHADALAELAEIVADLARLLEPVR